jgi:dolichyl-diphosphooligosaccharide--protein glycosyltransferase
MKQAHKITLEVVIVLFFLIITATLRIAPAYEEVYRSGDPQISSVDGYFFARVADTLVSNFPFYSEIDPYRVYPDMVKVSKSENLYIYMIAGAAKLFNISVNAAGVWIPPVLGILSVFLMYLTMRFSFGVGASLIGLALLSIMPGEFLNRTLLGESDRHCLEILQSIVLMFFFFLSIKSKPGSSKIFWSILSGVALGIYFLSWIGSSIFLMIIVVTVLMGWLLVTIAGIKNKTVGTVFYQEATICMIVASVVIFAVNKTLDMQSVMVFLSAIVIFGLKLSMKIKPLTRLLLVLTLGILSFIAILIFFPSVYANLYGNISTMFFWRINTATSEESPLLFQNGTFSLNVLWNDFFGAFFLFLIGIGFLIYKIKEGNYRDNLLLIVWGLILLATTLAMRRSSYYLVTPMCMIAGYFCWEFARRAVIYRSRKKEHVSAGTTLLIVVCIAVVAFIPLTRTGVVTTHSARISDSWNEALSWMKFNTKEPISEGYDKLYNNDYRYPDTVYGVLSWWDYGYWIIRESQRVTYSDPGGGNRRYAGWSLTSDNITEIEESMRALKVKYIIIDSEMVTGKFYSMVRHASAQEEDYFSQASIGKNKMGEYQNSLFLKSSYYESLAVRLYNFDAREIKSRGCPVFNYVDYNGFMEIREARDFPDMKTAEQYVADQVDGKYMIAGTSPYNSIVSLPSLDHFRLVFSSRESIDIGNGQTTSNVKIFEFVE